MNMPNHSVRLDDGNAYVGDMTHHYHIDVNNTTTVLFSDSVADGTTILATQTVAASTNTAVSLELAEPFGRSIRITSTDAGALTVVGKDYLGQIMTEDITCTAGTVSGSKAFKFVTELRSAADLAGDLTVSTGAEYGLPFCAVEIVREIVDGVASSEGTITVPDTDAPTASTGDVRGTFNPNNAGDGAKDIAMTYVTTSQLSGGLYGQVQA